MGNDALRAELTAGENAGHYVLVNKRAMTGGFLEDLQSAQAKGILDALSGAIVGGDLPGGYDREALRQLHIDDLAILAEAVVALLKVSKS